MLFFRLHPCGHPCGWHNLDLCPCSARARGRARRGGERNLSEIEAARTCRAGRMKKLHALINHEPSHFVCVFSMIETETPASQSPGRHTGGGSFGVDAGVDRPIHVCEKADSFPYTFGLAEQSSSCNIAYTVYALFFPEKRGLEKAKSIWFSLPKGQRTEAHTIHDLPETASADTHGPVGAFCSTKRSSERAAHDASSPSGPTQASRSFSAHRVGCPRGRISNLKTRRRAQRTALDPKTQRGAPQDRARARRRGASCATQRPTTRQRVGKRGYG